jgi:hypothetical protein
MLYVVEIRRERDAFADAMAAIREWLDARHFEPDTFRCTVDEESVTCRVEFKHEREARACADALRGRLISPGDKTSG